MEKDSYETMMRRLASVKPEKKDAILLRIIRGERHVPITSDEDLFYQVNKDRVTLEKFTNRDKFKDAAQMTKWNKAVMHDPTHGKSKGGKMRWMGDIPAEIYFSRKELSDPMMDKKERMNNIRKFLNDFPAFRATDKRV